MQKSISPSDMYKVESRAEKRGYTMASVMEEAARGVVIEIERRLGNLHGKRLLFVCGRGNNGADGLASARLAQITGAVCHVYQVERGVHALYRLQESLLNETRAQIIDNMDNIEAYDIVIDAIFGIGFKGTAEGKYLEAINIINKRAKMVLSVDVPSGMDASGADFDSPFVKADYTLCFSYVKDGLLFAGRDRTGEISVHKIDALNSMPADTKTVLEEEDFHPLLPKKCDYMHKGDNGKAGLFAGSLGMAGAAQMAGLAAIKSGAGLVSFIEPKGIEQILQITVPNAMIKSIKNIAEFDVIGAGCGLGTDRFEELKYIINEFKKPLILDADALNMLAKHPVFLGENRLVTPHVGEAARLLNCDIKTVLSDPFTACKELHQKFGCFVLLKNNASLIYDGNSFTVAALSAPALAKGGSGDVLLGLITSLAAQMGLNKDSIACAVLWLSLAGRLAEEKLGIYSSTSLDVISVLSDVSK